MVGFRALVGPSAVTPLRDLVGCSRPLLAANLALHGYCGRSAGKQGTSGTRHCPGTCGSLEWLPTGITPSWLTIFSGLSSPPDRAFLNHKPPATAARILVLYKVCHGMRHGNNGTTKAICRISSPPSLNSQVSKSPVTSRGVESSVLVLVS